MNTFPRDVFKPWNWATLASPYPLDPVEIVSYPFPEDGEEKVMVRMKVGDPTSMSKVLVDKVTMAYHPSSHGWFHREKIYYGGSTTDFYFVDELSQDSLERIRKREKS